MVLKKLYVFLFCCNFLKAIQLCISVRAVKLQNQTFERGRSYE